MGIINNLKHLPRRGWVLKGVPNPETVAAHMYRMGMSAFLLPNTYNIPRIIQIAIVHDLGEGIVGDITPHDNVTNEDK